MTPTDNFYADAHLFIAAVRILYHQQNTPPSVTEVCQMLKLSLEQGNFICNELQQKKIIKAVEGTYGVRLFVGNHLELEKIPKQSSGSRLEDELKRFQGSKTDYDRKIAQFKSKQEQKQKKLFAELEKKLKNSLDPP